MNTIYKNIDDFVDIVGIDNLESLIDVYKREDIVVFQQPWDILSKYNSCVLYNSKAELADAILPDNRRYEDPIDYAIDYTCSYPLKTDNGAILLLSYCEMEDQAFITKQDIEDKILDYHLDQLEEELLENV